MFPSRSSLRFLLALALLLSSLPGKVAAQVTIPRSCSEAVNVTQGGAGTTALVGPGVNASPNTAAQLKLNAANNIYICGYTIQGGASSTAGLEYGTKTTSVCDTGTTALTPAWTFGTSGGIITDNADYFRGLAVPAGSTLCIVSTTAAASVIIYYDNHSP